MVFAIGVFGNLFNGMLNTCLYSIYQNANESDVFIFWQNINSPSFIAIQEAYPKVRFIETNFDLTEKFQRRGSKMLFWEAGAHELLKEGYTEACFMDVDTLVLKDIKHFFDENFDIGFSVKDEKWPLNTGVVLIKLSEKTLDLMERWKEQSFNNIKEPENYAKAKSHHYPYGGPDQMAFYTILSFDRKQLQYNLGNIFFKGFDSKYFNETRSTEITEDTHLIHYKGGWQKVIIDGGTFSKKRKLSDSKEMYILYMKTADAALKFINEKSETSFSLEQTGIVKPRYLNNSYKINIFKYQITHLSRNFKILSQSYYNAFLNKLKRSVS